MKLIGQLRQAVIHDEVYERVFKSGRDGKVASRAATANGLNDATAREGSTSFFPAQKNQLEDPDVFTGSLRDVMIHGLHCFEALKRPGKTGNATRAERNPLNKLAEECKVAYVFRCACLHPRIFNALLGTMVRAARSVVYSS